MAAAKRLGNLTSILVEEGFGLVSDILNDRFRNKLEPDQIAEFSPIRIRRALEKLGPMFIKFGQVLGSRRDLLPDSICDELEKLQADVPPFSTSIAKKILEAELGRSIEDVFEYFSDIPLSAASLAQVHTAKLKSGEVVVVKIQRPNVREQFTTDLNLLSSTVKKLCQFIPSLNKLNFSGLIDNFTRHSLAELDFSNELINANRLREAFSKDDFVYIPKFHESLCTNQVLVLEKIEGHRFDKLSSPEQIRDLGFDPDEVVRTLVRLVYEQAYLHGVMHADMHGGNLFLREDGSIAMIDFGLVAEFSPKLQRIILKAMLNLSLNRWDEAAECAIAISDTSNVKDINKLRQEYRDHYAKARGQTMSEFTIAKSMQEEGKIGSKHGVFAPDEFIMLARALVTSEAIAIRLAPDLEIQKVITPIALNVMIRRIDPWTLASEFASLLPDVLAMIEIAPQFHRNLMKLQTRLAEGSIDEIMNKQPRPVTTLNQLAIVLLLALSGIFFYLGQGKMPEVVGVPWLSLLSFTLGFVLLVWHIKTK